MQEICKETTLFLIKYNLHVRRETYQLVFHFNFFNPTENFIFFLKRQVEFLKAQMMILVFSLIYHAMIFR